MARCYEGWTNTDTSSSTTVTIGFILLLGLLSFWKTHAFLSFSPKRGTGLLSAVLKTWEARLCRAFLFSLPFRTTCLARIVFVHSLSMYWRRTGNVLLAGRERGILVVVCSRGPPTFCWARQTGTQSVQDCDENVLMENWQAPGIMVTPLRVVCGNGEGSGLAFPGKVKQVGGGVIRERCEHNPASNSSTLYFGSKTHTCLYMWQGRGRRAVRTTTINCLVIPFSLFRSAGTDLSQRGHIIENSERIIWLH